MTGLEVWYKECWLFVCCFVAWCILFKTFSEMKCIKISFKNQEKWIVCGETSTEIISEAKKKFGVEEDAAIIIKDKDFTEIDEDVLEFFCKSKEEPYLRIFLSTDPISEMVAPPLGRLSDFNIERAIHEADILFEDTGGSTPSLSSLSTLTSISHHSDTPEEPNFEADDDLKKLIVLAGGQYILDQYQKNMMLTDRCRIQLVNIVANILYGKYGSAVPKSAKMVYAKKLVEVFPIYKNIESSTGGYEVFFNPTTNGGYLANRLRTLNRINKQENGSSQKSVDDVAVVKHGSLLTEATMTEVIKAKLNILMATPPTEIDTIKKLFSETFPFRRSLNDKAAIMEMFPRYRDTVGLVEQEFLLMFPACMEKFRDHYASLMDKILTIFDNTSSSRHQLKDCGFSLNIQSFFALLKMLPPSPKGKRKKELMPATKSFEKLIIFHQVSMPLQETIEKNSNTQPYIVAKGQNKLALEDYLIVLDGKPLPEIFKSFEDSFDYLMKVHFVFQVEYDSSLENFFKFVQVYFYNLETENVNFNSAMLKLKCLLNENIQH